MGYKIRTCVKCKKNKPWKWWWPDGVCAACLGTAQKYDDPADMVDDFDQLLAIAEAARTRKPQPGSERADEKILAAIRAEKQRLGEGAEHTRYLEKRPSTRWRARGVTMRRR